MDFNKLIKNNSTIGIVGHINPDGDCVGSCMGLYNFLVNNYTEADIHVYLEDFNNTFKFLKNTNKIERHSADINFDIFFAVDCADINRIGVAKDFYEKSKTKICIDHHVSNEGYANVNIIEKNASSASEVVYEIIKEHCQINKYDFFEIMNKDIAECIYLGIIHDTGLFQYSCTTEKTMQIAGKLMNTGINFPKIVEDTFFSKSYIENIAISHVIKNSKLYLNDKLIVGTLTKDEMQKLGAEKKDLSGVVPNLRNTIDCYVAIFIYQTDDGFKVSLRSKGDIDILQIATKYNGGGHKLAAGCTIDKPLEIIITTLISDVKQILEK